MTGRALVTAAATTLLIGGCTTMRPAVTPAPEAIEYRQTQVEIQQQQTELAVTGVKIEEGSRDIIQGIEPPLKHPWKSLITTGKN
jgi:hypothetical protein